MNSDLRLPAEWEQQQCVMLTWPHADTDWAEYLDDAVACFVAIAREILQREPLLIVTPEPDVVRKQLTEAGVLPCERGERLRFFECATNDTWARDHGFITLLRNGGERVLCDFTFNGWGMKFAACHDNRINEQLHAAGVLRGEYCDCRRYVLEGGSIESDGNGTVLTSSECLLAPNRNYFGSCAEAEQMLKETLACKRVLWLHHGYLAGDDTDSHIDTIARLCPNDTIVYVQCTDEQDEHYTALKAMEDELRSLRTADDAPYRLLPLPMADAVYDGEERIPATYANFLVMNGAVLMPTYAQEANDAKAKQVLQEAFPDREIVGVDCRVLIRQHGSLHCVTMQFPQ